MKTSLYISLVSAFIVAAGCQKVELQPTTPPTSDSPVFHASILVDGDSSSMEVGENIHLTTDHEIIGIGSYFSTSFTDLSGNDLLSFEFGMLTPLNSTSLSSLVNFGSLTCDYELDVNDLFTNLPFAVYSWEVDGTPYFNSNGHITEFGEHDVSFYATLADGSEITLHDKVIVGGLETDEPEILISSIGATEYLCFTNNLPPNVDAISWELHYGNGIIMTSNDSVFHIVTTMPMENFTVICNYYSNGELVNYYSTMYASPLFPAAGYVDFGNAIINIENAALPMNPQGKITYNHNGTLYSTQDNTISTFLMSNMDMFIDEYTNETYFKGQLQFGSYLYSASGDSIYVEISSEIGFSDVPN
ncbi:MAG: hypothetical protein AB8B56_09270 [Crocinitomicaceae bacterium]